MAGAANPQMTQQAPMGAQPNPMGQGGQNVFNQAAGAYGSALSGTQQAGMGPNINQFMNPYNQEVIDRSMGDIGRAQQIAMNQLGTQASQAGAFGGSRQGVAEALTNEGFIKQMADTAAGLRQQGFGQALGAAQNQQNIGLQAAGQMGNLAQTGFGFGQSLANQQAQQGGMMQGLNQLLIDAGRGQFGGFTGAPQDALNTRLAGTGAANMGQQTQTQSRQPGLFDYLQLAAQTASTAAASDRRLKTNVRPLGKRNGVNIYSWDWTKEGARIASPDQPTVGVMADELILTHPHLVHRAADGYLRVNYSGL